MLPDQSDDNGKPLCYSDVLAQPRDVDWALVGNMKKAGQNTAYVPKELIGQPCKRFIQTENIVTVTFYRGLEELSRLGKRDYARSEVMSRRTNQDRYFQGTWAQTQPTNRPNMAHSFHPTSRRAKIAESSGDSSWENEVRSAETLHR